MLPQSKGSKGRTDAVAVTEGLSVAFAIPLPRETQSPQQNGYVQLGMGRLLCGPQPGALPGEEWGRGLSGKRDWASLCMVAATRLLEVPE